MKQLATLKRLLFSDTLLILVTIGILLYFSWDLASRAPYIALDDTAWKLRYVFFSLVYVSVISAVISAVVALSIWLATRRRLFLYSFCALAIVLVGNRDFGPRLMLPDLGLVDIPQYATPSQYLPELQAGPEYNFRKTRWGMSVEEVIASEDMEVGMRGTEDDGTEFIAYPQVRWGAHTASLEYFFDNNGLQMGKYFFYGQSNKIQFFNQIPVTVFSIYGQCYSSERQGGYKIFAWDDGSSQIFLELAQNIGEEPWLTFGLIKN